ncbi:Uncharacterised protein [Escherichia coli]|uniref:Uncharacterized protein n=1 Tax=Escherichia coli TaxID=562 RepID=A0A377CGI3_ECOLX|nr:Uncharacterised protein [Escherichia coli]
MAQTRNNCCFIYCITPGGHCDSLKRIRIHIKDIFTDRLQWNINNSGTYTNNVEISISYSALPSEPNSLIFSNARLLQLYVLHVLNAGKVILVFFHCDHCGLTELRMNVDFCDTQRNCSFNVGITDPDAPCKTSGTETASRTRLTTSKFNCGSDV